MPFLIRGVVALRWCSVPWVRKVAGSNLLGAMLGPWASPSLVVACMTLCGALHGCIADRFDFCNSLLSSVHTLLAVCQLLYLWRTGHKYRLKDLYLTDVSMQRVLAEGNGIIIDAFSKRVALLFARWRFTVVLLRLLLVLIINVFA